MDSKHPLAGKKIVIAGAGLAGLIFARTLEQQWPDQPRPEITIYERSEPQQSRGGYSIGIRIESGLKALHKVGLLQETLDNSTWKPSKTSRGPSIWDKNWNLMFQAQHDKTAPGMPEGTPSYIRISRQTLCNVLSTKVTYNTIVERFENGTVYLSDGTTTPCDLLVAADGANSRIRKALIGDDMTFAGVVCYIGQYNFPQGKPEPLKDRWGFNLSGSGRPLLLFPVDDTRGVWATSYRTDQPVQRVTPEEADQRFDEIIDEVHKLVPDTCNHIIDATERNTLTVFNAMHRYPVRHTTNVLFLGDANHPMSPFSGNGANMALMDGVVAAEKLIECSSISEALAAFDAESMPRSRDAIDKSWWTIRILHARGLTYWVLVSLFTLVSWVQRLKGR